jgi:hypothetical protein
MWQQGDGRNKWGWGGCWSIIGSWLLEEILASKVPQPVITTLVFLRFFCLQASCNCILVKLLAMETRNCFSEMSVSGQLAVIQKIEIPPPQSVIKSTII